jgi:hypothetical protein
LSGRHEAARGGRAARRRAQVVLDGVLGAALGAALGAGLAVVALSLVVGCADGERRPQAHEGPIVLITLEGLRGDMIGGLGGEAGWTPQIDRWIGKAEFSARAVAPSAWAVPALASLATGLRPWQHQALTPRSATLAPSLRTLAEALHERGFRTTAFGEGRWFDRRHGHDQGFDAFLALRSGKPAERHLRSLDGGPELVWIQIPEPRAPFHFEPEPPSTPPTTPTPTEEVAVTRPALGEELSLPALAPYFDPARAIPAALAARLRSQYRAEVARVDARVGRLLRALEESGQRERTLVVLVSAYGQHLGENGLLLDGTDLRRELIDVPLVIDLPETFDRSPRPASGTKVAAARVWATLVEAAGGVAPPGVAPSLWSVGVEPGVLSELYAASGSNRLSWIEGDLQLHYVTWFTAPSADFYAGRPFQIDPRPGFGVASPRAFGRHYRAFLRSSPIGRPEPPPELRLERWTDSGVEPVDDPERLAQMRTRLLRAWNQFVERPRTPAQEEALRIRDPA